MREVLKLEDLKIQGQTILIIANQKKIFSF